MSRPPTMPQTLTSICNMLVQLSQLSTAMTQDLQFLLDTFTTQPQASVAPEPDKRDH